jgi:hypothetical protein
MSISLYKRDINYLLNRLDEIDIDLRNFIIKDAIEEQKNYNKIVIKRQKQRFSKVIEQLNSYHILYNFLETIECKSGSMVSVFNKYSLYLKRIKNY